MLDALSATLFAFFSLAPVSGGADLEARDRAIDRCAAVAEMLATAYTTYPDDIQRRTALINTEKKGLQDRLGVTDKHLMSAYGALSFHEGKRLSGVIAKDAPIRGLLIAAEGAARCMAATDDRGVR